MVARGAYRLEGLQVALREIRRRPWAMAVLEPGLRWMDKCYVKRTSQSGGHQVQDADMEAAFGSMLRENISPVRTQ